MQGAVVGRKRGRHPSLRVFVVDDHCGALSKIHGAIRRGALPFAGLSALHFDAHPDLMVTPDMPAETCFRPQELYHTLATAEGGIAEWILPLVYQGHLSKLWWIRPPWARQFADGDHRFYVGQVKTTGSLRVSSTAPYFVDDRLYCPEEDMRESKPLHLCVSLVPAEGAPPSIGQQAGTGLSANSEISANPQSTPPAKVEADAHEEGAKSSVGTHETGGVTEGGRNAAKGPASTREGTPASQQADTPPGDDVQSTPWVLDICLDYFTTENPFMAELENYIGKEDAAVVRDFYEKPTFRGAGTPLPHATQLEHERIFKTEVDRLLRSTSPEKEKASKGTSDPVEGEESIVTSSGLAAVVEEKTDDGPGAKHRQCPGEVIDDGAIVSIPSEEVDEQDRTSSGEGMLGLQGLAELFDSDGEDRLLAGKFASIVGRIGREGREKVAWTDHCACLPRYLATHNEVKASVRAVETLLRSLLVDGAAATTSGDSSGTAWKGPPGVITVARSEDDGYVPAEMVAFVEREVLAMLNRLYGGNQALGGVVLGGDDLEVCYEEGLEPA